MLSVMLLLALLTVGLLTPVDAMISPDMTYIPLCEKPGLCRNFSRLLIGTDHLGQVEEYLLREVLTEAFHCGITTLDTGKPLTLCTLQ